MLSFQTPLYSMGKTKLLDKLTIINSIETNLQYSRRFFPSLSLGKIQVIFILKLHTYANIRHLKTMQISANACFSSE